MASLEGRSVRRSLAWDGLRAFEAVYQPHTALAMHEHSAPFFTYVLRGEFVERPGGGRTDRECRRGSVIFHPPCDAHANAVGPRGTMSLNVEISPEFWTELASGLHSADLVAGRVLSGDVEWLASAVWREFHREDAASGLSMDETVALLCSSLRADRRRTGSISARRLALSREYISQHLTPAPRLAEVAQVAGVHPMHLARLFRERYGYSMGEFVRRRRIAWACGQLASADLSLAAIALAAGFADQAHFSRTFRRVTGCTPRWYRQHLTDASGVQDRGRLDREAF